jgi:cobalt-zinc-cadmium efflux system outer membrane protein
MGPTIKWHVGVASVVAILGMSMTNASAQPVERSERPLPRAQAQFPAAERLETGAALHELVAEALARNPELQVLGDERRASRHRAASAGALDDPMLEAGVLNLPVDSLRFNREDMTMKMIGVSQRLPFPGKRSLREEIAAKEASTVELNYHEAANRVVRDVKVAYFDLGYVTRAAELIERNRKVLEQFLQLAEARYSVGQSAQADVLKAQTQLARMIEEGHRVQRERKTIEAELTRAVGRSESVAGLAPVLPEIREQLLDPTALEGLARSQRPQLAALQSTIERADKSIELSRKDYLPDFDVRFQYGQRDRAPDGMRRDDMVSLTVAISLPVWRQNKLDPKLAEAQAMRDQALSMYRAQESELRMRLRQQVAIAEQSQRTLRVYDTSILPQSHFTVEAALSAYRVNRVDMLTLLDSQMAIFGFEVSRAQTLASYHKALAEIDLLTGKGSGQ